MNIFFYRLISFALLIGLINAHDNFTSKVVTEREKKTFGLFAVVTFPNDACTIGSNNALTGTCLTTDECASRSGSADGNCASGFGVCCLVTVNSCSSTAVEVSQNCTYIQNPGFPTAFTNATTCNYNINRIQDGICQIRYDIQTGVFGGAAPAPVGTCGIDTVRFTTPTASGTQFPPTICGTLTGQHVYLESGSGTTQGSLAITTTGTTTQRQWNIKVSYIPCDSNTLAPADCFQYFTGRTGRVKSFDQGNSFIINQRYRVCVRQELGFCGVDYNAASFSTLDTAAVELGGGCGDNHITFTGEAGNPRVCGGNLCGTSGATIPCTVSTIGLPQGFQVFSSGTATTAKTGFDITYTQRPC